MSVNKINVNNQHQATFPDIGASNSDFDIRDTNGYVLTQCKDGHLKTKEFDSASAVQTKNSKVDLEFIDSSNNCLMRVNNGHIKTKNFDSLEIIKEKDTLADLEFEDSNGNIVLRVNKGHIITKNFNSSDKPDGISEITSETKYQTHSLLNMFERGRQEKHYSSSNKKFGMLVGGQSNAEGRVPQNQFPISFIDDNGNTVNYLNSQGVMENTMFIDKQINGTGLSPWSFSKINQSNSGNANKWDFDAIVLKKLQHYLNDTVYSIKWAVGSTPIYPFEASCWTPRIENLKKTFPTAVPLLLKLEQSYRLAKQQDSNFEIRCMLWHQGEDDATNTKAASLYYQSIRDVVDYVRGFTDNPTLPFICGSIPLNGDTHRLYYDGWEKVNDALFKLADEDSNFYCVNLENATMMDEGYFYHFDAQSNINFADSIFNIIKTKIL